MPDNLRINSHIHLFPLKAVKSDHALDLLEERLQRDVSPDWLGKLAGKLAREIVDGLEEDALLEKLLDALAGEDAFERLVDETTGELPAGLRSLVDKGSVVAALENRGLSLLRRVVTGVVSLLRSRDDEDDDHAKSDFYDLVETLRIAAQSDIAAVTRWHMRQLAPDEAVVPLMMDITKGDGADDELFVDQLLDTSAQVLAYPGRVLPFVFAHPVRQTLQQAQRDRLDLGAPNGKAAFLEVVEKAVSKLGFIGVKLYPSLGYDVDTDDMEPLYEFCAEHNIPLLMHCNKNGFVGQAGDEKRANPEHWRPILERNPNLKICFAHFGGSGELSREEMPDDCYALPILEMMEEFDGVYADISFHRGPMESPEAEQRYFKRMREFLGRPELRGKILFGTDQWLIRTRLSEAAYWRYFEQRLGAELFKLVAVENTHRFLGFADAAGAAAPNQAIDDYCDFVLGKHEDPPVPLTERLSGPPAEWMIEAVEESEDSEALEARAAAFRPATRLRLSNFRQWIEEQLDNLPTLGNTWDEPKTFELEDESALTPFEGLDLDLGAEMSVGLHLFHKAAANDPHQPAMPEDEDEVLSLPAERPPGYENPLLRLDANDAYLKYRLAGSLTAEGGTQLGNLGIKIDAELGAALFDYRRHDRQEKAIEAVLADLRDPRFAFSRSDVLKLGEREAVGWLIRGSLGATATLSISDVLTYALPGLSSSLGLPAGAVLGVQADASLTASYSFQLDDDFRVVFARQEDGRFRVEVRKAKNREQTFKISAAAEISWSDESLVRKVIGGLAAQAQQLGSGDAIAKLEEEIREALEKAVIRKAEVGFTYEYRRVASESTLLLAEMGRENLEQLHPELVQGELSNLLYRVRRGDSDIDVISYLRHRIDERHRSWGFTLGPVWGKDWRQRRLVEEESLDPASHVIAKRISFLGQDGYEGRWWDSRTVPTSGKLEKTTWRWAVDFKADTVGGPADSGFRTPGAIDTHAFEYGLVLRVEWDETLSALGVEQSADLAEIWRLIPEERRTEVDERVEKAELFEQSGKVVVELSFDHAALARLLRKPVTLAAEADALAAAQAIYTSSVHRTPALRRKFFGPLWRFVLDKSRTDVSWKLPQQLTASQGLRLIARKALFNDLGAPLEQARIEEMPKTKALPYTFCGNLFLYQNCLADWETCRGGLDRLAAAVLAQGQPEPDGEIEGIYGDLSAFLHQAFGVRALGAYLVDRAGGLGDGVTGSFQIESGDTTLALAGTE